MDAVSENTESAAPLTLGQTLAAERERQGMSRADVAQRLHMSAWQVEALEGGEYGRLPKGPFLRGFVRNYAKVLGLDAAAILAMLSDAMPSVPAPRIVVPTQNIRFDPMSERLASPYVKASLYAVVAVALGFAAMYYWMYMRPGLPGVAARKAAEANEAATAANLKPDPPLLLSQATAPAETPAPAPASPPPSNSPSVNSASPVPAAAPVPPSPSAEAKKANAAARESAKTVEPPKPVVAGAPRNAERNLKFRFKGESWVEVRDGRGRVLIQRLNAAGSEAEVTGRPPFQIIVGNAPDVQMSMNDKAFDLEPHTRVAVARFTVE